MKSFLKIFFLCLWCNACAPKYILLSAEVVSMTEQSLTEEYKMQEVGPIEEIYCPNPSKDPVPMGAIDELIKNAQQKSGSDFITHVRIFINNDDCLTLNGTGNKKTKI